MSCSFSIAYFKFESKHMFSKHCLQTCCESPNDGQTYSQVHEKTFSPKKQGHPLLKVRRHIHQMLKRCNRARIYQGSLYFCWIQNIGGLLFC